MSTAIIQNRADHERGGLPNCGDVLDQDGASPY